MLKTAGYVQARPVDFYRRKNYEWCTLEYVMEGEGFLEINDHSYQPKYGDIYILHKGSDHEYYPNKNRPWKKFYMNVEGSLVMDLFTTYQLHNTYFLPQCDLLDCFESMYQIAKANKSNVHQQAALLFHQMLYRIVEQSGDLSNNEAPDDLMTIKEFIDSSIEKKITMEDITKLVSQSSSHVIRKFKKEFHVTPYEYLLGRRIGVAKLYLANTGLPIKEIAFRLQFANEYYFSTYFKKRVGESPLFFRKRNKIT